MSHALTTRIPFAFARSALFRPAEHRGDTFAFTEIPSACDYPITLHYSGPELTPCHATAWQALVAIAFDRNQGTTPTLAVRLIDILRAMGRSSIQTHAKRWLRSLLEDLANASVTFSTPRQNFNGPLLAFIADAGNGTVLVEFPAQMDGLLSNEVVHMPVASKAGITSFPLASWLHDYIATHRDVYEIPLTTLHALCGSTLALATFRRRVCRALDVISNQSTVLTRYALNGDTLTLHKRRTRVVLLGNGALARVPAWQERACQEARNQRIRGFL